MYDSSRKNNSKCAFFFDTAGGTYTCCSVQFYSQSVTIRSKKKTISMPRDSPVSTFYKVQPLLNLPRKETRLQRGMYVHKEGGVQCRPCHRSFPVKTTGQTTQSTFSVCLISKVEKKKRIKYSITGRKDLPLSLPLYFLAEHFHVSVWILLLTERRLTIRLSRRDTDQSLSESFQLPCLSKWA